MINLKYVSDTGLASLIAEVEAQDSKDARRRNYIYSRPYDDARFPDGFDWRYANEGEFTESEKIAIRTEKFLRDGGKVQQIAYGDSSVDADDWDFHDDVDVFDHPDNANDPSVLENLGLDSTDHPFPRGADIAYNGGIKTDGSYY